MTPFVARRLSDGERVGAGVIFESGVVAVWVEVKHRALLVYQEVASFEAAAEEAGWEVLRGTWA